MLSLAACSPTEDYKRPELLLGTENSLQTLYRNKPVYIDLSKIEYIKVPDVYDDLEKVEFLISHISNIGYNTLQPLPYVDMMETHGANCQSFTVWFKEQLTYNGLHSDVYLSEGYDHMYNLVYIGDDVYAIDLSRKEMTLL